MRVKLGKVETSQRADRGGAILVGRLVDASHATGLGFGLLLMAAAGCAAGYPPAHATATAHRGGVTIISPRCDCTRACLLGQVVAAESAVPMVKAAVFLELEGSKDRAEPVRFLTLTDDQGVFAVVDAPAGRYRLAIYKDARRFEVRGLDLEGRGTTMVPVRLPRG